MELPRCCVCGDEMVELPGQTADLPAYALASGDAALEAGVVGPCWQSALVGSAWGRHWADRLAAHFERTGLTARPRKGAWRAFRSANLPELTLIRDDGRQLDIRLDRPRRRTIHGLATIVQPREYNLHLGPARRALATEIQARLRRDGAYPLVELFDALGVRRRLLEPTALFESRLAYDAELADYWTADAVSAVLEHAVIMPREAADIVEAEPDQRPLEWMRAP